jgi:hypothetical protein
MRHSVLILLIGLLLSACASQSDYVPASSAGPGFGERQLGERHFMISFTARGTDRDKSWQLALRRAAEVTLDQGYDWFVISRSEVNLERQTAPSRPMPQPQLVRECNLLGCRTHSLVTPGIQPPAVGEGRRRLETLLEIRLGKGVKPVQEQLFDAAEIVAQYQDVETPEP